MGIDDPNRAPDPDATVASQDATDLSQLARAVSAPDPKRLDALRLKVESGEYEVPAEAMAESIIDEHLKE